MYTHGECRHTALLLQHLARAYFAKAATHPCDSLQRSNVLTDSCQVTAQLLLLLQRAWCAAHLVHTLAAWLGQGVHERGCSVLSQKCLAAFTTKAARQVWRKSGLLLNEPAVGQAGHRLPLVYGMPD